MMNEEKEPFKIQHSTRLATLTALIGRIIGYGLAAWAVYLFTVQKPFHSLGLIAAGAFVMAAGGAAANMMDNAAKRKKKE